MVTKTLAPMPAPRRKHALPTPSRPPPMPPKRPSSSRGAGGAAAGGGSERSQRSGSAYLSFSFPERRGPLRASAPLAEGPGAGRAVPAAAANKHYVFVYGSLQRGHSDARLMDRATYIGEFRTVARFPLVAAGAAGGAPYLLNIPEKGAKIKGEVYAVDDALLADLDHLEKVGAQNVRKVTKVCSCADRSFVAQAYVYFASDRLDEFTAADAGSAGGSGRSGGSRLHADARHHHHHHHQHHHRHHQHHQHHHHPHRPDVWYARGDKTGGSSSGR